MKTVTIYTDGHKNRFTVLCGMSVLLAPKGATAEHDKQAPSDRHVVSRSKFIRKELI